ncbi:iron-containing alcohol dehydrogenase [Siminovitchia fordii]|uniref:Alcohol dehydrogenase n=1 Tax=Siminovitchia fordii TaxID=254759 RepID=A0ABQ4K3R6_9BACI|nr:iron-containing alcohol dehydrogenase [Siminovitchia fordii]GIN19773.1 alcohol dehydrogenase [Siminovitchia fordii]
MNFQFTMQTNVLSEPGVAKKAGFYLKEYGAKNVLIVTDQAIVKAGLLEGIYNSLKQEGLSITIYDHVNPNPKNTEVETVATRALEDSVDGLIAVGGGSVMDFAKGVGVLLTHEGSIKDWEGDFTLQRDITPLICIPTTVGTGSEVTWIAVITDTARNFKMGIVDPKVAPKMALLDSDLIRTLPPSVTASTGMDAMTHAIEAYTSRFASPMTDALAYKSIVMIKENIEDLVSDSKNQQAGQAMLNASMMAGIAFNNSNVGSVHCLSEAIGGYYDLPHGVLNSIFLPFVFKRNIKADPSRHAEIAYLLGAEKNFSSEEEAALEGFNIIMELRKSLNLPKFNELERVTPEDFKHLAKVAKETPMDESNAKEMSEEEYLEIIEEAFSE